VSREQIIEERNEAFTHSSMAFWARCKSVHSAKEKK
jgi:hypothetical protein